MTIVVRIKRHFLSEGLDITEQLEVGLTADTLGSHFGWFFFAVLGDLVNFENSGVLVENMIDEPK